MTIERIVELEQFIEREMKGNEALTNDAGCVARAKIDRDILACLKELRAHREAWEKAKRTVKAYLMLEWFGSAYQDDIENLIEGCIPKEGDAE